ncbi:MAG: helix-turn-helix domain-containing protein, partial [Pirellulales bacterium]
ISEEDAVRFLARQQVRAAVELPQIGKAVLRKFGLQLSDLTGKSRRRHIVAARSVLMYLARQLTDHSLAGIGRYCGGRDHTTTLHNCRKIAEQINTDPQLRQTIDELRRELQPA